MTQDADFFVARRSPGSPRKSVGAVWGKAVPAQLATARVGAGAASSDIRRSVSAGRSIRNVGVLSVSHRAESPVSGRQQTCRRGSRNCLLADQWGRHRLSNEELESLVLETATGKLNREQIAARLRAIKSCAREDGALPALHAPYGEAVASCSCAATAGASFSRSLASAGRRSMKRGRLSPLPMS